MRSGIFEHLSCLYELEGGESSDSEALGCGLVNRGIDFGNHQALVARQFICQRLPHRLQCFTVSTPWSNELNEHNVCRGKSLSVLQHSGRWQSSSTIDRSTMRRTVLLEKCVDVHMLRQVNNVGCASSSAHTQRCCCSYEQHKLTEKHIATAVIQGTRQRTTVTFNLPAYFNRQR